LLGRTSTVYFTIVLRSPPQIFGYLLPFLALCGYELSSKKAVQRWRDRRTAKITIKICNPYPNNNKTTACAVIFFNEHLIVNQNKTCCSSASPPPIREAASVLSSCYKAEYLWELPVPFPMRAQPFLHGCPHGRFCINC